jgi:hypothetical protein
MTDPSSAVRLSREDITLNSGRSDGFNAVRLIMAMMHKKWTAS